MGYNNLEYKTLCLKERSRELLKGRESFKLHKVIKKKIIKENDSQEDSLFSRLKELRKNLADERGVPAFYIFSDKSLQDMTNIKPRNKEEFLLVHGVGKKKCENYSKDFLSMIHS